MDLAKDFALRFEVPIAEDRGQEIRKRIRDAPLRHAEISVQLPDEVVAWAQSRGDSFPPRVIEAHRNVVRADVKNLRSVGSIKTIGLREQVTSRLVTELEGPIRKRCQEFVAARPAENFQAWRFGVVDEGVVPVEELAEVPRLNSIAYVRGDERGATVLGRDGRSTGAEPPGGRRTSPPPRLLATADRGHASPLAVSARLPGPAAAGNSGLPRANRADARLGLGRTGFKPAVYLIPPDSEPGLMEGADRSRWLQGLFSAVIRQKPPPAPEWTARMVEAESRLAAPPRPPDDRDRRQA